MTSSSTVTPVTDADAVPAAAAAAPVPATGTRQRILSGMQPSADSLHLGNYLGALVNWVRMQDEYDAVFFIPDLHAITVPQDPAELAHRTRVTAAQYIAGGVDVDKCTLFVQSQVPEHAQLAWVLNCITGFGEASRMTQFKDKASQARLGPGQRRAVHLSHPAGRGHPPLPAARRSGGRGPAPARGAQPRPGPALQLTLRRDLQRCRQPFIQKESAKIYDLQHPTAKMSKSAESPAGLINLLDDPKVIAKRIKSAVTDAETEIRFDREAKPGVSNLLTIYSAITGQSVEALVAAYQGKMYGHLKVDLAEVVAEHLTPIRDRANELLDDPAELDRLLALGADKAREIASVTLRDVYAQGGFPALRRNPGSPLGQCPPSAKSPPASRNAPARVPSGAPLRMPRTPGTTDRAARASASA